MIDYENTDHSTRNFNASEATRFKFWGYDNCGAFSLTENGITGMGSSVMVIDQNFQNHSIDVHGSGISKLIKDMVPDSEVIDKQVHTPKDVIWALRSAINNGVSVASMSIGTSADKTRGTAEEIMSFLYYPKFLSEAESKGVSVVVASGYSHTPKKHTFAEYEEPIVVGGMRQDNSLIDSNDPNRIDIYAPGEVRVMIDGRERVIFESHSGAVPYVSATCAAISSIVGHDVERVKDILFSSSRYEGGVRVLDVQSVAQTLHDF